MTTQRNDRQPFESGASVFNSRGQRVNEIDLDRPRHGQTIDEMTRDDWRQAEVSLREFDGGAR
jgi:hypothetical protein